MHTEHRSWISETQSAYIFTYHPFLITKKISINSSRTILSRSKHAQAWRNDFELGWDKKWNFLQKCCISPNISFLDSKYIIGSKFSHLKSVGGFPRSNYLVDFSQRIGPNHPHMFRWAWLLIAQWINVEFELANSLFLFILDRLIILI